MTEQQKFLEALKDPLQSKINGLVYEFVHDLDNLNYMYDDIPRIKHTETDGTHLLRIECKNHSTMSTIDGLMGHKFDGYCQYIRHINTDADTFPMHEGQARIYHIKAKTFGY